MVTYKETEVAADYNAFAKEFDSYLQTTTQTLNTAASTDFTPDLTQLDALVESLQIKE